MMVFNWWFWIAGYYLILLTYQDLKNKTIDDRLNYVMKGATIALIAIRAPKFAYILILLVFMLIVYKLVYKYLADGDASTAKWLVLGWGAIGITPLIVFIVIWLGMTGAYALLKKLFKSREHTPYFPVYLGAHILASIAFFVYILGNVFLNKYYQ